MKQRLITSSRALVAFALALPHSLWAQDTESLGRALDSITPDEVRQHVMVLADDSMRGRATPSPELELAAHYLSEVLRRAGLSPGGDGGSYHQRYAIERVQIVAESSAVWISGADSLRWTYGVDYLLPSNDWLDGLFEGELVVLSGPLNAEAAFDTTFLRGRVLLLPEGPQAHYRRVAGWRPAAILYPVNVADSVIVRIAALLKTPQIRNPVAGGGFPMVVISDRAISRLLARHGFDVDSLRLQSADSVLRAMPIRGVRAHVRQHTLVIDRHDPANIIAILEGSDPTLRAEHVVYTAHFDHLGVGAPIDGDSIYNGADDNASGTASLVAVAKAFTYLSPRPRRSLLFAFVSGEESGAWGSQLFLDHAPVSVSAMVANLNADMVGRNWTDTVVVLGRHDSDLGQVLDRVTSSHPELGLAVVDSSTQPDEAPNLYVWSDHAVFIQRGVPFLFFYSGMHPDYHRPSDSVDKVDAEKLARISQLMFLIGLEVANADTQPRWDPESYARLVPQR